MLTAKSVGGGVDFQCSVIGYEFPDSAGDDWCLLKVSVAQGADAFERIDPAIEAPDLVKMRDWFDCLSTGRLPRRAHLSFVEPCISFDFLARSDAGIRFGIHLGAELTPPFPLQQFGESIDEWHVVFELPPAAIAEIVVQIDAAIARFPARSGPGGTG